MKKVYLIAKFLDNARWGNYKEPYQTDHDNYYLINECGKNLPNDSIILSHWTTYCVNRQTPFKLVFNLGGFIFSDLVVTMQKHPSLHWLDPNHPDSFFIDNPTDGYQFRSHLQARDNAIILSNYEEYQKNPNQPVTFKPRFYPRDYMSILCTMVFLEEYDYRFSVYFQDLMERFRHQEQYLKRMVFGLHLMAYRNIGQFSKGDLQDFNRNVHIAKENAAYVKALLDSKEEFERGFQHFQRQAMYHQKRLWCCIRDYLKCGYYRNILMDALKENGCIDYTLFQNDKLLTELELPGDVWNNNPKFWGCILKNTRYNTIQKQYNRHIRGMLEDSQITEGYPELFDFTFEFIPRMCEKDRCAVCIFKEIQDLGSTQWMELCVHNTDEDCPLVKHYCDFQMKCKGDECELYKLV